MKTSKRLFLIIAVAITMLIVAYVIDPEECMADNFADAMQYGTDGGNGQGYPNPEIIQGIMEVVR